MKQPIVKGHPLHAILTDIPAAGFVLSYGFDLLSHLPLPSGKPPAVAAANAVADTVADVTGPQTQFRDTANAVFTAAYGGGAVAGLLGWWDFLNIPQDHPARQPAFVHGMLNSGLLVLGGVNLLARRRSPRWGGTPTVPLLLSTFGIGALVASAWIGGDLVYRLGWRVRPAEELEIVEKELPKTDQPDLSEKARHQVEEYERSSSLIA